jgi:hypothetical protein
MENIPVVPTPIGTGFIMGRFKLTEVSLMV